MSSSANSHLHKKTYQWEQYESWNFQEWFAQEYFSAHGDFKYDVSSVFVFGPAPVRIAPEPPPIGPFGRKF
jgi:hypothetical protein